jgi:hypothetical protein
LLNRWQSFCRIKKKNIILLKNNSTGTRERTRKITCTGSEQEENTAYVRAFKRSAETLLDRDANCSLAHRYNIWWKQANDYYDGYAQ